MNSISALHEVPFKISTAWSPLQLKTIDVDLSFPVELLEDEYSFELEDAIIADYQRRVNDAAEAYAKLNDDNKPAGDPETAPGSDVSESFYPCWPLPNGSVPSYIPIPPMHNGAVDLSRTHARAPAPFQPPVLAVASSIPSAYLVSKADSILTPVPLSQPNPMAPGQGPSLENGSIYSTATTSRKRDQNLDSVIKDFETDSDSPFDNVALKSLNDLEELKSVLQLSVASDLIRPPAAQLHTSSTNGHYYSQAAAVVDGPPFERVPNHHFNQRAQFIRSTSRNRCISQTETNCVSTVSAALPSASVSNHYNEACNSEYRSSQHNHLADSPRLKPCKSLPDFQQVDSVGRGLGGYQNPNMAPPNPAVFTSVPGPLGPGYGVLHGGYNYNVPNSMTIASTGTGHSYSYGGVTNGSNNLQLFSTPDHRQGPQMSGIRPPYGVL